MRLITIVLILISPALVFSQVPVRYTMNDIEKLSIFSQSLTSLELTKNELFRFNDNSEELEKLLQNKFHKSINYKHEQLMDLYLDTFDKAVGESKSKISSQEFLWKAYSEISKTGVEIAVNYSEGLLPSSISNITSPIINRSFELYVDKIYCDKVKENREDADRLILKRMEYLFNQGINDSDIDTYDKFENVFAFSQHDFSSLDRDDFPIVNRKLTQYAYTFINDNYDKISELDTDIDDLSSHLNDLNADFNSFKTKIGAQVEGKFTTISNSIGKLVENQELVFEIIEEIEVEIENNSEKIGELEVKLSTLSKDVQEYKLVQKEHSELLKWNSFQLNILTKYTFQNLSISTQIEGIEKGDFNFIFSSEDQKKEVLDKLYTLETTETIITVSNKVSQYSTRLYSELVTKGILKGNDAEVAGEVLHYLNASSQSIIGVARLSMGDLTGAFSLVSGLGSLITGPSKSEPSPEMKMLNHIYETMVVGFENIDRKLNTIDSKIDSLYKLNINMYESLSSSMQILDEKIDYAIWQNNILRELTIELIKSDYNYCIIDSEATDIANIKLDSFTNLQKAYINESINCIQALSSFTNARDHPAFYLINAYEIDIDNNEHSVGKNHAEYEATEIYNPVKTLVTLQYKKTIDRALNAALFPVVQPDEANQVQQVLSGFDSLQIYNEYDALDNYINYSFLDEFYTLFSKYSIFFEVGDTRNNYAPPTLNEYFHLDNDTKNKTNAALYIRYRNLLNSVNNSIIQQSLIAGSQLLEPTYATLFYANQDQTSYAKITKDILNINSYFTSNFFNFLIKLNVKESNQDSLLTLLNSENPNLSHLNSLISGNDFSMVKLSNNEIVMQLNVENDDIYLSLPKSVLLKSTEMRYTPSLYRLIEIRTELVKRMIDLSLFKYLDTNDSELDLNIYKYIYLAVSK